MVKRGRLGWLLGWLKKQFRVDIKMVKRGSLGWLLGWLKGSLGCLSGCLKGAD